MVGIVLSHSALGSAARVVADRAGRVGCQACARGELMNSRFIGFKGLGCWTSQSDTATVHSPFWIVD